MNNLKPFLFWIVVGAILFIELVIYICALPDLDLIGDAAAARASKTKLDVEYVHLTELDQRAKKGSPTGVYDPENADDIKKLTDDFLITGTWKAVLDPHVQKYEKHLKDITAHLAERSASLHKPIADSGDKLGWYTAYQAASEALLHQLASAGCLRLPVAQVSITATVPSIRTNKPTWEMKESVPVPRPSDVQPPGEIDYAVAKEVRDVAGLYTKVSDYPEPTEHPQLTIRFRIIERLSSLILESAAANSVSPLHVTDVPPAVRPVLSAVTWVDQALVPGGGVAAYGTGIGLSVLLRGPLSTLLAAQAAFERSDNGPVIIVSGCTINRKADYAPGERKDVTAEQGEMRLSLVVLDLTAPASAAVQGAVRGAVPGGYPGAVPGGYPGVVPGGYPGAAPGGYPGAPPGWVPGAETGMPAVPPRPNRKTTPAAATGEQQ